MDYGYLAPTLDRNNSPSNFDSKDRLGLLETTDGDWVVGSNGDLLMATTYEVVAQRLAAFMQTRYASAEVFPNFGNRLEDAYGKSLDSIRVLDKTKSDLINDLNRAGFFVVADRVEVLPASNDSLIINLAIINTASRDKEIIGQSYQLNTGAYTIEFLGAVTL